MPQPVCSSVSGKDQNDTAKYDPQAAEPNATQANPLVWGDVYPIFVTNCLDCHGPQKHYAGFRADQIEDFFKNDSGSSLVLPGQSSESQLIAIILGERTNMAMAESHKLSESEVSRIKTWIDQGAK